MKAYSIYNDNLDTIKQYLSNPNGDLLLLDLGSDSVYIGSLSKGTENTRVLATVNTKDVEEVRQSIIRWLWEQADIEETKRKMEEFAKNVPNFDIDDDEEFETL